MALMTQPKVYLVGDNNEYMVRFRLTLMSTYQEGSSAAVIYRSQFRDLSDEDVKRAKFIFVFPNDPSHIIYDETYPSRSFHEEFRRADSMGNDLSKRTRNHKIFSLYSEVSSSICSVHSCVHRGWSSKRSDA